MRLTSGKIIDEMSSDSLSLHLNVLFTPMQPNFCVSEITHQTSDWRLHPHSPELRSELVLPDLDPYPCL